MPEAGAAPATGGEGARPTQGENTEGQPQGGEGQPAAAGDPQQLGAAGLVALEREREARRLAEKKAKDFESELKVIREKDLPEAEKQTLRLKELEDENRTLRDQYREANARQMIQNAAAKAGFTDPGDAALFLLADPSLKRDSEGLPTDIDKAVGELLKVRPYLAAAAARPSGSADAGNAGAAASGAAFDMNAAIRRTAGRN